MSKFNKNKVLQRYFIVALVLTLAGVAIIAKAAYTMTSRKSYWEVVGESQKSANDTVRPNRGNILSSDGQLLASSIPEYKIFMDFQPGDPGDKKQKHLRDSAWAADIDSLCLGLHEIFPEWTPEQFRERLEKGRNKVRVNAKGEKSVGARHWWVWPRRISYSTYCEVEKLPYFRLPKNLYGFHYEQFEARRRPFGSLAERTIGDIRSFEGGKDTARFGIELYCDSILRGSYGLEHTEKIFNKKVPMVVTPPIDGADVVTTIDVGMQDLAEKALVEELEKWEASIGIAILMEVKTGDVKAMVNMRRCSDGKYRELYNDCISYACEPGSVFKTASILVALDDAVVDTTYVIHTGKGVMRMHNANMKDHNWARGGYGSINLARTLEVSSNIGVSYVIDHFYGDNPRKYVEGLYRVGIGQDLGLDLSGYHKPWIRYPDTKTTNKGLYWSKTPLPWMSIGYETKIPPINTVTFYNAIANNGRMMRPRFVKSIVKDDVVLREYPPQVIKEQIARPEAIATMQTVLRHVVSQGLGKKAGSTSFQVSGKTGTAQVSKGKGGYRSGITEYWLAFCGYFPSDNPMYTCIVCMRKAGLPASGGSMSGAVFHNISEGVMARSLVLEAKDACDSLSVFTPDVKSGDDEATGYVLGQLGIGAAAQTEPDTMVYGENTMPNIIGMGATDAVYLAEQQGVKVRLHGTGQVKRQSIAPGMEIRPGMTCSLELE